MGFFSHLIVFFKSLLISCIVHLIYILKFSEMDRGRFLLNDYTLSKYHVT